MVIDRKAEESMRSLIGNAVRGELDELTGVITETDPERLAKSLELCMRVAAYVVIDVCGHAWPTDADLREIAQRMSTVDLHFNLEEPDAYAFLADAALGFEPLSQVFADKSRAVLVPILTNAALLVSYRTGEKHWWEYLDVIEQSLERAASVPEVDVPAVLLWSRLNHAAKTHRRSPPRQQGAAGG